MTFRQLFRKPINLNSSYRRLNDPRRISDDATRGRVHRIIDRMPRFMQKYTTMLRNAPVSHAVSFLILHEITAIIPVVGLAWYFHATQWLPVEWSEGSYIASYVDRFDRYFRRKGWFGLSLREDDQLQEMLTESKVTSNESSDEGIQAVKGGSEAWSFTSGGSRIVVEVATAYAITKAILPLRIGLSIWATPWFARIFVTNIAQLAVKARWIVQRTFINKTPKN